MIIIVKNLSTNVCVCLYPIKIIKNVWATYWFFLQMFTMRFRPFANMKLFGDYRQFVILVSVLSAIEGYCKYFSLKIQKLKLKFTKNFRKILEKHLRKNWNKAFHRTLSSILQKSFENAEHWALVKFFQALTCIFTKNGVPQVFSRILRRRFLFLYF